VPYLVQKEVRLVDDLQRKTKTHALRLTAATAFWIAASLSLCNTANAVDLLPAQEAPVVERMAPEWTFAVDPFYSWLPGFNGNVRVFGVEAGVDITTSDILHNLDEFLHALDGLYMGSGELRYQQFGLQYDIVYLSLSGGQQLGNQAVSGALDAAFSMTMATLAGNWRFYETPTAYADLIGGVRVTDVQVDLALSLGSLGASASDGDTWIDPVVGLKGRLGLNPHWYLKGSALYGGFGVASDSLYDLAGLVGYEWDNGIELYGGWRVAGTDYSNDDFKWDMQMSGPTMGLTFKF
jgi:hypothetical protein